MVTFDEDLGLYTLVMEFCPSNLFQQVHTATGLEMNGQGVLQEDEDEEPTAAGFCKKAEIKAHQKGGLHSHTSRGSGVQLLFEKGSRPPLPCVPNPIAVTGRPDTRSSYAGNFPQGGSLVSVVV